MSCFINGFAFAQIAVGHNTPDIHAQLDIKAEQKGILIPRITLEDPKLPIPFDTSSSPLPESLLVYNKKNNSNTIASGYYYWQNDQWHKLITQEDINIPEKITTTHKLENNDIHKNTIKSTVNKAEASVKIISTVSNSLAPANTSGYPLTTTVNGVNSNLINIPQPWNIAGEKTKASTNTQNIYQQGNVGIGNFFRNNNITEKLDVDGNVRIRYLVNGTKQDDYVGAYKDGSLRRIPEYLPRVMNIVESGAITTELSTDVDVFINTNDYARDHYMRQVFLPKDAPKGKIIYLKKHGPINRTSSTYTRMKVYDYKGEKGVRYKDVEPKETVLMLHLGENNWTRLITTNTE